MLIFCHYKNLSKIPVDYRYARQSEMGTARGRVPAPGVGEGQNAGKEPILKTSFGQSGPGRMPETQGRSQDGAALRQPPRSPYQPLVSRKNLPAEIAGEGGGGQGLALQGLLEGGQAGALANLDFGRRSGHRG